MMLYSTRPNLLVVISRILKESCSTLMMLATMSFRPNTLNGLASALRARCPHRSLPLGQSRSDIAARPFSSTLRSLKRVDFTQKHVETPAQDEVKENQQKAHHKPARKNAGKTSSLRSVAVEAQRSRTFVKSRGRQRFVDPDANTKVWLHGEHTTTKELG
jgi:hypothetical protein